MPDNIHPNRDETAANLNRRSFLAACSATGICLSDASVNAAGQATLGDSAQDNTRAIDFSRSFLYCAPKGTDIWVRPQIECLCQVFDRSTSQVDEYVLSVVAKTGLTRTTSGLLNPGYDYWIIFSDKFVYTRRTHASSYFNNPTTLALDEFGMARWRLHRAAATRLRSAAQLQHALEAWQPIVARTEFWSDDGGRGFALEYPVKWADINPGADEFRVETGPVVLLDAERVRAGTPLAFEDFQWAHLDYRSFDKVRCLLDRPTSILTGAMFTPPREHGREGRRNPALTEEHVKRIESRLFDWSDSPISSDAMRELFQTDHYSAISERGARTQLCALSAAKDRAE